MKKRKLLISTFAAISLFFGLSLTAFSKELDFFITNIKLFLNEQQVQGQVVIIDGSSYLPVRALSEAMGLDVTWNSSEQTILLNKPLKAGEIDVLHSKWQGTYVAGQGETSVTVTTNGEVATFEFGPTENNPDVPNGKFTMLVEYNPNTQAITLTGVKWTVQPSNYGFVDFVGSVSDNYINGAVIAQNSYRGNFTLKLVN